MPLDHRREIRLGELIAIERYESLQLASAFDPQFIDSAGGYWHHAVALPEPPSDGTKKAFESAMPSKNLRQVIDAAMCR